MDTRARVVGRRVAFVLVIVAQLALIARAYWSSHDELGFQMFPEASTWQAEVVRVTGDGRRIPIEDPWSGYRWDVLVRSAGLGDPSTLHHADAGIDNTVAFLASALDWVAANTPNDTQTRYLEADVTYWRNRDGPHQKVLRSREREVEP